MDIMELLLGGGDPAAQQRIAAEAIRQRQQLGGALQRNTANTTRYDMLNFAAQAAGNNPNLAAATGGLQKSAQLRGRVQPLGQSGVIVGDEVLDNPAYGEQKDSERTNRLLQTAALLQGRRDSMESRAQTAREMEEGRMQRHQEMLALREMIAQMANSRATDKATEKAAKDAKGKTIPAGQVSKLADSEGVRDSYGELTSSFKDEFAATPVVGGLQNTLGKLGLDRYRDQSNWWQNYLEQSNKVRHALFGSALTANEQKAFEAATITPGMDPKEIRRRLAQQHRAAALAQKKVVDSLSKAGYSTEGFSTDVPGEVPLPGVPGPAAPAAGGKKRIKIDLNGNIVP